MRPKLQLKPVHNSFLDILIAFNNGKPLNSAQRNFLHRYVTKFSSNKLDEIYRYYALFNQKTPNAAKKRYSLVSPFTLKQDVANALEHTPSYQIHVNPSQLAQLKLLLIHELIFLHGNQYLTGAPFFAGGVPHIDFFQWGNYYGVIKYEEILGESALDANILIHFVKKQDESLLEFAKQYQHIHVRPILQPVYPHDQLVDTLNLLPQYQERPRIR